MFLNVDCYWKLCFMLDSIYLSWDVQIMVIEYGFNDLYTEYGILSWFIVKPVIVTSQQYRVLTWNSRWRSPIGLTQSDLRTSSHGTADWFSPLSVANELAAQHSNKWLVQFAACFSNPPPSPANGRFGSFSHHTVCAERCWINLVFWQV